MPEIEPPVAFVGVVDDVRGDSVWATLTRAGEQLPDQVVELPMRAFQEEERHLVQPGTTFDWVITPTSKNTAESAIHMREPRYWTQEEIDDIQKRAKEMRARFNAREEQPPASPRSEDGV